MLQKESADETETRAVLSEAVSHLRSLQETDPTQWKEVLSYILQLVLHKRSAAEHPGLIELIAERSQDTEVTPMAESMAEVLIQQGIEQGVQQGIEQGVQQGIEQGVQQGTRESLIEGILENLEVRFQAPHLETVASTLVAIEDVERLRALRRESLQTPSLLAFQQVLGLTVETNGNAL